jgi:hypothetical protein
MPRPAHVIALCVIGLLMLGVVMVSSADMAVKTVTVESPVAAAPSIAAILTSRTMVYAGMAIAALVFAACLPIRQLAAFAEGVASGGAVANDGDDFWRKGGVTAQGWPSSSAAMARIWWRIA